jgi:hypothetical protein
MSAFLNTPAPLRLYDPDLPMLAAQAAIELDSLRRGKRIGLSTVNEIGNRLRSSLEGSIETGKRAVLDSSTFAIVGPALDTTEWAGRVKTTDELISGLGGIADAMNKLAEDANAEQIEKIRNFCVALSKYAAAYRQSLQDLEPTHSFRR